MKNRKIAVLPIAVLSLGALVGCNKNIGNITQKTLEQEIDEALQVPDNLHSLSNYQALKLTNNAKEQFKQLSGVTSKNLSRNLYSKIYTGSYAKLKKDNELSYEIESKYYSDKSTSTSDPYAYATIRTEKHDTEIENGVETKYNASRVDTLYYDDDGTPLDNIQTYQPDTLVDNLIGEQDLTDKLGKETSKALQGEKIRNYMRAKDQVKLGSDGNGTDLGYFFQDDSNNAYCVKFNNKTEKLENPIDPTKHINVLVKNTIVMHFTYNLDVKNAWASKTYASTTETYYDRDLNDNVFDTPLMVSVDKFYSKGNYNILGEYTGEIKEADKLGTGAAKAYVTGDARGEAKVEAEDNSFALRDVTAYSHALGRHTDEYVFTVVGGEDEIAPVINNNKESNANAGSTVKNGYDKHNGLDLLTELYSDIYITQRNSDLEYKTAFLSKKRTYKFFNPFNTEEVIKTAEIDSKIDWLEFDKENGVLKTKDGKEGKSGEYNVTITVKKESDTNEESSAVYISFVRESTAAEISENEDIYYDVVISNKNVDKGFKPVITTFDFKGNQIGEPINDIEPLAKSDESYTYRLLRNTNTDRIQRISFVPQDYKDAEGKIKSRFLTSNCLNSVSNTTVSSTNDGILTFSAPTSGDVSIDVKSIYDADSYYHLVITTTGTSGSNLSTGCRIYYSDGSFTNIRDKQYEHDVLVDEEWIIYVEGKYNNGNYTGARTLYYNYGMHQTGTWGNLSYIQGTGEKQGLGWFKLSSDILKNAKSYGKLSLHVNTL